MAAIWWGVGGILVLPRLSSCLSVQLSVDGYMYILLNLNIIDCNHFIFIISPRTLDIIAQCTCSYAHARHAGESLPVIHGESTGAYYFRDCFAVESNITAMFEYFIYDIKMNAQK